jgi:hypothetical protein
MKHTNTKKTEPTNKPATQTKRSGSKLVPPPSGISFMNDEAAQRVVNNQLHSNQLPIQLNGKQNAPFPFRYVGKQNAMSTVTDSGGGFVQYPSTGLPEQVGEHNQGSIAVGRDIQSAQHGSHRAITQSAVMNKISPNVAAKELGLHPGAYEWLHLVAFSIKQTHVSSLSAQSMQLIKRTDQPQQIQENLVLGTAGANTAMLTYETLIKDVLRSNPMWSVDLFVNANIIHRTVHGVTIPVANRIDFHFQFRTDSGEITPPVILAFDPKNPAAPTLQEYSTVVGNLKAFVQKYHQKINGFQGLRSTGFTKV